MKVSIITVCFNSGKTIRDTIESVLSQSYTDIEYIIIDGASKDNTLDIIGEYGTRITKVISGPDKGIYDAMNKGIAVATGEIVGILNSDDFYEASDTIAYVVDQFTQSPANDVIYGDVVFCKEDDTCAITRTYRASHFKAWKLRFGWMPPHPATFVKRTAYHRVGEYSTRYKISADYEMFVRMLYAHKLSYRWMDKIIVKMRQGGVSTSGLKSSILLNREIVKACRDNGLYTNLMLVLTKIPFKLLEFFNLPKQQKI